MLNITIQFIISTISIFPVLISSVLYLRLNRKFNDRVLILHFIAWFSMTIYISLFSLGTLFFSHNFIQYSLIALISMMIFSDFAISLMIRDNINIYRLPALTIISIAGLIVSFLPDNTYVNTFSNGDQSPAVSGYNQLFTAISGLYIIIIYIYFGIKLRMATSKLFRTNTTIYLTGILITGPVSILLFLFNVQRVIPSITMFTISLGALISTIAIYRQPQLLYMLPFQTIKLSVISRDSGIDVFTYDWNKELYEIVDPLYTSVITAINAFTEEVINLGRLKEIKLEGGTMQIWAPTDQCIYYVLLSSKTSHTLRVGMTNFIILFHERYKELLTNHIIDIDFSDANDFINVCFPFIPLH